MLEGWYVRKDVRTHSQHVHDNQTILFAICVFFCPLCVAMYGKEDVCMVMEDEWFSVPKFCEI